LSFKDRELVSFLLQLSQKNELISKVANQLNMLKSGATEKNMKQLLQLLELLEVNVATPVDWSMIESQLEKIHPGFFNRLQTKHPIISVKDKKLCAYLTTRINE
jgi:uncharacterized membrane protein